MFDGKFTEEDKKKVIDFLNYVATNAEFTHKTSGCLEYVKLLGFMQSTILKKIDENILEILAVKQNPPVIPEE